MSKNMLAAVFKGEGRLELEEVFFPRLKREDEVLLKVEAASICGTDIHILEVPPGHPATKGVILGHEYTAKVLEVGGDITHLKEGDRVVIDPNITCGYCEYCRLGLPNTCVNMTTLGIFIDGGFAQCNLAPAKALHKISSSLPEEEACLAEPLSCVINGAQKVKLQPGESVVVLGAGPIGLLFTLLFKSAGAGKIIVAEVNKFRSEFALKSGADLVVDPTSENLEKIVKEKTGLGADVVVDAVGSLFAQTLGLVRNGGSILLFGMNEKARGEIKQYDITRREIKVLGTFIANATFPPAVKMLENKVLEIKGLITHQFPLSKIKEGVELMRKGEAIKVIIKP